MGMLGILKKQPREALPVEIDYTKVIGLRTADSITATVEVPAGMVKDSQQVQDTTLQVYVSGGTAGEVYTWTVLTTIVIAGRTTIVEDEFVVEVQEVSRDMVSGTGTVTVDAMASAPGADAPVVNKRQADARTYIVDMAPLLRKSELVKTITSVTPDTGLTATAGSVIEGRYVELNISGGTVPLGQPSIQYTVKASCTTTRGTVQANVTVKVWP